MYLLYVDESGDIGLKNSPSECFVLSGLVVHELRWRETLDQIIRFRREVRQKYGLKLREEIHAHVMIHRPGELRRIPKSMRLRLLRDTCDFLGQLDDLSIINVVCKKRGKDDHRAVFETAWRTLIQRFHNTIANHNFPGPANTEDRGLIIPDRTDEKPLRELVRRLGQYNPVPNLGRTGYRDMPIRTLVEDPVHRDSRHSYFLQMADVTAFFVFQRETPCTYIKHKGGRNYLERMKDSLCLHASRRDPLGIVRV